jgi:hypothetical protein
VVHYKAVSFKAHEPNLSLSFDPSSLGLQNMIELPQPPLPASRSGLNDYFFFTLIFFNNYF